METSMDINAVRHTAVIVAGGSGQFSSPEELIDYAEALVSYIMEDVKAPVEAPPAHDELVTEETSLPVDEIIALSMSEIIESTIEDTRRLTSVIMKLTQSGLSINSTQSKLKSLIDMHKQMLEQYIGQYNTLLDSQVGEGVYESNILVSTETKPVDIV